MPESVSGGMSAPGGWCLLPGGVCSWGGCGVCSGGVCSWGVSALGVSAQGGGIPACIGCLGGICSRGEGVVSQHTLRQAPPCEQNDKQVQKYYLGHNFIAAGKNYFAYESVTFCHFCHYINKTQIEGEQKLISRFHPLQTSYPERPFLRMLKWVN